MSIKLADIELGKEYLFDSRLLKYKDIKIFFSYLDSKHIIIEEFNTWKKCHNQPIIAIDFDPYRSLDSLIVCFSKYPDKKFILTLHYIAPKLEETRVNMCNCNITILMTRGCQCGGE